MSSFQIKTSNLLRTACFEMNPTALTSSRGGQVDRENTTKWDSRAHSPWKKEQSSPKKGTVKPKKRASHFKITVPVSGTPCSLMLWNVWDSYFRKQKRCLNCTKMKQPGISRITETDWTGADVPTADGSEELMKIFCTKILSRLSLREEKSEQISETPRTNIRRH